MSQIAPSPPPAPTPPPPPPPPPVVGFSSDTMFTTASRENLNFSLLDFLQGPWDWKRSFCVVNNVVRSVLMNRAVSLGVQSCHEIQINSRDTFRCGDDQVFYQEDGTPIIASALRVGQRLRGIIPQNNSFSGQGLGLLSTYAGAIFEVTSRRQLSQPQTLYHASVVEHDNYMLACGLVVQALPTPTP